MAHIIDFPKKQTGAIEKPVIRDTEHCAACKKPLHDDYEYEYTQNNHDHKRIIAFCDPCEKEMQRMGVL